MAAGQGFKTFTTGEVLTAGDVNGYLMQGINVFTNATARDAAITAPAEGQFAFTKDNNSLWYYDGAAWVASGATGDIEGVTATSPLTGGGTSGTVTVGIQDASTSQRGSVQLSDSTSTTSSVLAATPTAVKSAYDLANAAIPKTLTTTTGDTIYASGANTPARLGIGTTGQVLTVSGGVPTWATPSGSSATLVQITSGTLSGTSLTLSGLSSYDQLYLVIYGTNWTGGTTFDRVRLNGTANNYAGSVWGTWGRATYSGAAVPYGSAQNNFSSIAPNGITGGVVPGGNYGDSSQLTVALTNCKAAGRTTYDCYQSALDNTGTYYWVGGQKGVWNNAQTISSIVYETNSGYTFTGGSYILWGA
jgi:hypothetical protein